jgi:hypothetical protein
MTDEPMTASTAHVYHAAGRPWSLGLGFDTFVCDLDPSGTFRDAALQLMARGWRLTGAWVRDERSRMEKWSAPVEGDGLDEEELP